MLFKRTRGSWIQYRAYTLTLWTGFVLTFATFTNATVFEHRSSHNEVALFLVSFASLVANIAVFAWHIYRIRKYRLNPFNQEIYAGTKAYEAPMQEEIPERILVA